MGPFPIYHELGQSVTVAKSWIRWQVRDLNHDLDAAKMRKLHGTLVEEQHPEPEPCRWDRKSYRSTSPRKLYRGVMQPSANHTKSEDANQVLVEITWSRIKALGRCEQSS